MKRSFLSVLVAASLVTAVACAGDEETEIEPGDDVMQPAPAPPPPPPPPTTTDTMADSLRDTTTTTTSQ
jgi:hypothetical protein